MKEWAGLSVRGMDCFYSYLFDLKIISIQNIAYVGHTGI